MNSSLKRIFRVGQSGFLAMSGLVLLFLAFGGLQPVAANQVIEQAEILNGSDRGGSPLQSDSNRVGSLHIPTESTFQINSSEGALFETFASIQEAAVNGQVFQIGWSSTEEFKSAAVDVGDIDGDGDLDIVFANGNEQTSEPNQIYLNDGLGNFELYWQQPISEARPSGDVALGDYDNDGDLDVVFGNHGVNNDQLYRNDYPQGFQKVWESDTRVSTSSVTWGDLDGDGDLDLFIATQSYYVVYENKDGNLVLVVQTNAPHSVGAATLADLNIDGDLDLIVAMTNGRVYENAGSFNFDEYAVFGSFSTPTGVALADTVQVDNEMELGLSAPDRVRYYPNIKTNSTFWDDANATDSSALAWGDYDLDGLYDLAVARPGRLYYLLERAAIASNPQMALLFDYEAPGMNFNDLAWGDFDDDGDLDLVAANGDLTIAGGSTGTGKSNYVLLNQATPTLAESWRIGSANNVDVMTLGDVNGDNYLDIVATGRSYINQQDNTFSPAEGWPFVEYGLDFALGDIDNDLDLDIITVDEAPTIFRINKNNGNGTFTFSSSIPNPSNYYDPEDISLGDIDSDGDLDIFVGNRGQENLVYRNHQDSYEEIVINIADQKMTTDSALVDLDLDGFLDLIIANDSDVNQVYRNMSGQQFVLAWESDGAQKTTSVTTGDFNGDGLVDFAFGNFGQKDQAFINDGNFSFSLFWESTGHVAQTERVVAGDVDGDGDQDVLAIYSGVEYGPDNEQYVLFYRNDNNESFLIGELFNDSIISYDGADIAIGDTDNDGDLDVALLYVEQVMSLRENVRAGRDYLPNDQPYIYVEKPYQTPETNGHFASEIIEGPIIPFTYSLFDDESDPLLNLKVFFSTDGGGNWQPATPTTDTVTYNLGTAPFPNKTTTNTHLFKWDTFADGLFGQYDNLSLRFVAYPQLSSEISATVAYTNATPQYIWPYQSTTVSNLRIRGTSIRVLSDTMPVANAIVHRIPNNQSAGELLTSSSGEPFITNQLGYLQGRWQVALGDQIIALLPVTETNNYTIYHSNVLPTSTGINADTVTASGIQTITVSSNNPIILFNLNISLEWDARDDATYLAQLDADIQEASRRLFDISNGQAALGKVQVFHNKENWLTADVVIHASNTMRPNADLGGSVNTPTVATLSGGTEVENGYLPGQVRMGATWNRNGDPGGTLGVDWPRALAHELAHYFFFVPDNYLGLDGNDRLIPTDCQGSVMTDAYRNDYSEFLTTAEWQGDCLNTVAEQSTGRSDWETVQHFYPLLDGSGGNVGPSSLPLAVTTVTFVESATPADTLQDPYLNIVAPNGSTLPLPFSNVQAYQ
ncbi:MAG: VCBS repeat-containing protein, partial [Anaerolineales bacterium]|nr:VCBS repeat-containing protein [Anaerolineales bacterium]